MRQRVTKSAEESQGGRTTLEKSLKAHWVWAIALGSAIGWGAFVQPINWMATAGPLGVIIGFSIGALLMMLIAVSYGVLIKSFPVSGGEFAYAFLSLGRTHAFISGWFLTLGYVCIVALNASAFALMLKYVFPPLIENVRLYTIAGWDVYIVEIIAATLVLAIFGYANIKGTGLSGRMQFLFVCTMVIAVVGLTFSVGIQPGAGLSNVQPLFAADKTAFAAIISIVAIAPWAFVGFDAVPQAAEEFNFPARKAFMLIIFALLFAAILYIFMTLATAMTRPWEGVASENHLWGTGFVIQELLGPIGLAVLVVALSMGIFTGLNGFTLAGSRLLFAMGRAKILPSAFEKIHPKYKTPYIAIIFTIVLSALAPWFGREALVWVVDMSSIGVSIAYFYTCFTAYFLFKWSKDAADFNQEIHVVSPIKKLVAAFGALASLVFIGLLLIPGSPAFLGIQSRIALLIWVLLGVVVYFKKRKEFNSIPERKLSYLILGSEKMNREELRK